LKSLVRRRVSSAATTLLTSPFDIRWSRAVAEKPPSSATRRNTRIAWKRSMARS
jgi:hypothetical protein